VNLAVSKIGPALMAGNAVVIKPPTQGAVSAIQMVQVCPCHCRLTSEAPSAYEGESSVYMTGMRGAAGLSREQQA
jgi:acyl-CoA reductase-like NAD-dependent aldehyde dehydrogenase